MYQLKLEDIQDLLMEANLLKEVLVADEWQRTIKNQALLDQDIKHLTYNSREVQKDSLFFAKGFHFKEEYITDAIDRGASFFISEKIYDFQGRIAFIVTDIRLALAIIARAFYDYPDRKLKTVGVTGTKGKSSITYMIKDILQVTYPGKVGLNSTITNSVDGIHFEESELTTPESLDLFAMLAEAVDNQLTHFIFEASSQAFKHHRLFGIRFDIGIFSNFGPDHISDHEHPDMEDYFSSKRKIIQQSDHMILFDELPHLDLLIEDCQATGSSYTVYGRHPDRSDYYALIHDEDQLLIIEAALDLLKIKGRYPLGLPGDFNELNALAASIATKMLGASNQDIGQGLATVRVPGRMEVFHLDKGTVVIVDYAHNEESLEKIYSYCNNVYSGHHITTVFGIPGDRGHLRQKGAARVFDKYGGTIILTTDDPRFEDPDDLSREVFSYMETEGDTHIITDRIEAIHTALDAAGPSDIVLILGKGTETTLDVGTHVIPYPGDIQVVKEYISDTQSK